MKSPARRVLLGLGVLAGACDAGDRRDASRRPTPVDVRVADHTSTAPTDDPAEMVRGRRRMDLDQLEAAIRRVTGGLGWTGNRDGDDANLFVELSSTLGKPDFIRITEEDLSASPMFRKLLADAARSICTRLIAREASKPRAERIFFVHTALAGSLSVDPASVLRNLQYLLLRFHGRSVAVDDLEMESWRRLLVSTGSVSKDAARSAWRAVCVRLLTHPDFYMY